MFTWKICRLNANKNCRVCIFFVTGKYHKIRSGETLGSIARKYRVTVKQIMKWNNMRNTRIRAGRRLKIY